MGSCNYQKMIPVVTRVCVAEFGTRMTYIPSPHVPPVDMHLSLALTPSLALSGSSGSPDVSRQRIASHALHLTWKELR